MTSRITTAKVTALSFAQWPAFDLGEAVNQTISAAATFAAVLLAAKLALDHLRREKAMDRRLDALTALLPAIDDYQRALSTAAMMESHFGADFSHLKEEEWAKAKSLGNKLNERLSAAELFAPANLDELILQLRMAYVLSTAAIYEPVRRDGWLLEVETQGEHLKQTRDNVIRAIRQEVALEKPARPRWRKVR